MVRHEDFSLISVRRPSSEGPAINAMYKANIQSRPYILYVFFNHHCPRLILTVKEILYIYLFSLNHIFTTRIIGFLMLFMVEIFYRRWNSTYQYILQYPLPSFPNDTATYEKTEAKLFKANLMAVLIILICFSLSYY
jgi:hypothetical protein